MPDRPEHFEGTVTVEWTPDGPSPMRGWRFMISAEDGTPITTVTGLTIHASAGNLVWAELTMFTDEDGRPVCSAAVILPNEPPRATFAFEVAGMGVADTGLFGPLSPIPPVPLDGPPGSPRPEPRRFQYPVGYGAGGHE